MNERVDMAHTGKLIIQNTIITTSRVIHKSLHTTAEIFQLLKVRYYTHQQLSIIIITYKYYKRKKWMEQKDIKISVH